MKKTLFAAFLAVAGAASVAQAADVVEAQGLPGVYVPKSYVGVQAGTKFGKNRYAPVGVVVGRELNENVTVEGNYEYLAKTKGRPSAENRLTGNVLVGKQMGVAKPYALVGAGYEWGRQDRAVYAAGVGSKFALTQNVDFDLRYRYVDGFSKGKGDHVVTAGLNVNF